MPAAAPDKSARRHARRHRRPDGRAREPSAGEQRQTQAHRPRACGGADAGARRTIRRQNHDPARRRRAARVFDRDVLARHRRSQSVEQLLLEFVCAHVGLRRAARQLRRDRAAAAAISAARTRRTASWTKSAVPPAATCGRSLPTSRKRCWPTISRTNIRRPSRSCSRSCAPNMPRACSPSCRKNSRSTSSTACCAWRRCRRKSSSASSRRCAPNSCPTSRRPAAATRTK